MASVNQDFVTYKGNAVSPIFTVRDASGNVVDISDATQITWEAIREADSTPAVSLSKTGGEIVFVTDGTDGKFQVNIPASATSDMDGFYLHVATITDAQGNTTTVTVGRMQVGVKPTWTYDATVIGSVALYQVRRLIGDVIANDQQMSDAEIEFLITQRANVWGAAAECARSIAGQYSRKVDTVAPGEIRTAYSQQARSYMMMAEKFEARSQTMGAGATAFAGGISVQSKEAYESDTDRVTPQFNIGMDDNLNAPVPPVGNETPTNPAGGSQFDQ